MLGGAGTKKLFPLKMLGEVAIKEAPQTNSSNTKKFFPRKMLVWADIKKPV